MTKIEIAKLIAPALITVVLNIIFYLFIKSYADKRIEQNKIIYGGLFQEKLKLYREIMIHISNLKKDIFSIRISTISTTPEVIQSKNLDFTHFFSVNEAFWSQRMAQNLVILSNKFDDASDEYISFRNQDFENKISKSELENKMIKYQKHLTSNSVFNIHIEQIVEEMREDLQIKNFNKYL